MTFPLLVLAVAWLPLTVHAPERGDRRRQTTRFLSRKNRVLTVFAPTPQDPAYQEEMKLWQGEKAGFDDRQLVVVPVFANAKKRRRRTAPARRC